MKIRQAGGTGIVREGDDIDTDQILPARFLKEITFARMGEFVFFDERYDSVGNLREHPFNDARCAGASILFVNRNFGCGSSREHAPQGLMRWGIRAIVGESFAAIFENNCQMLGIPAVTVSEADITALMKSARDNPATTYFIDLETGAVTGGPEPFPFRLSDGARKALMEGAWDSTATLLMNREKIAIIRKSLPYINNFAT